MAKLNKDIHLFFVFFWSYDSTISGNLKVILEALPHYNVNYYQLKNKISLNEIKFSFITVYMLRVLFLEYR